MSTLPAQAQAQAHVADTRAIVDLLRERMRLAHNGFLSNDDVAAVRASIAELGRLRVAGEKLAERLAQPEFNEHVAALREVEISLGRIMASGRPVYAS